MKKLTRILLWLMAPAMLLLSTSCFDITEEYHIHKDGSGTAIIKMDMSQMITMMESFGGDGGGTSSKEMDEMFEDTETMEKLRSVPGISNVQNISNRDEGIVGWSYDFASLDALNQSLDTGGDLTELASSMGVENDESADRVNKLLMKGKTLTRIHPADQSKKEKASEEDKQSMELAAAMLAEGEYNIIYHFDQRVKSTNIPNAVTSADGRTVSVKTNLGDLAQNKVKLGGKIKLK